MDEERYHGGYYVCTCKGLNYERAVPKTEDAALDETQEVVATEKEDLAAEGDQ